MPDASVPEAIKVGYRPELASGGDWREQTTPPIAKLIEECWAPDKTQRPHFGRGGVRRRVLIPATIPDDEELADDAVTSEGGGEGWEESLEEGGIVAQLERLELTMTKASDISESQLSMVTRLINAQSTAQENEVTGPSSPKL